MKTVMQTVLDNFNKMGLGGFEMWIIDNEDILLEKEKEQIINAYYEGDKMEGRASLDDAQQYYNETYNQQ
jgi:hypothetical protein